MAFCYIHLRERLQEQLEVMQAGPTKPREDATKRYEMKAVPKAPPTDAKYRFAFLEGKYMQVDFYLLLLLDADYRHSYLSLISS